MSLPPFNDTATCPKCGHTEVKTSYSNGTALGGPKSCSYSCSERGTRKEHLERCCERCSYSWPEAPLT